MCNGVMKALAHSEGKRREQQGGSGGASGSGASGSGASMPEPAPTTPEANVFSRDQGNYEELALIGNGAYGTVYKARDIVNNGIVALKKIRIPLNEDGIPMHTLREIALLKRLDLYEHPNIVRLLDICQGQRLEREQQLLLFLVFEHVDQDLSHYLDRCPPPGLPPSRIKDIMFQLFCGVDFLHSHGIIHRDLKPQNILVTNNGTVKLADFGLAKIYDYEMKLTTVVVTLWYRPPEILLGQAYASAVDIWSCGCIMAELYRLQPLFAGSSEGDQLDRIFRVIGTPSEEDWPENVSLMWSSFTPRLPVEFQTLIPEICPEGKDLLQQMLRFNASKRVSSSSAIIHPYFKNDGYVPLELPTPSNPVPVSSEEQS